MLPIISIWNTRVFTQSTGVFLKQSFRLKQLTPISSYHHFLRKEDETVKRKTGFGSSHHSVCSSLDLYRAIHSHKALFCINKDQKIENQQTEKKIERKEVTLDALEEGEKLGLVAKFKKMAKEYWYVLIPVHCVTSAAWGFSFYYASVSGVDIVGILEHYHVSETIIKPLRSSSLGHFAVAYLLYKIATPARYFVTLAGTTFAIRQGIQRGLIKPMPSKDAMMQIYKDKKDDLKEKVADKKQAFQDKKQEFQDKFMKKE